MRQGGDRCIVIAKQSLNLSEDRQHPWQVDGIIFGLFDGELSLFERVLFLSKAGISQRESRSVTIALRYDSAIRAWLNRFYGARESLLGLSVHSFPILTKAKLDDAEFRIGVGQL